MWQVRRVIVVHEMVVEGVVWEVGYYLINVAYPVGY